MTDDVGRRSLRETRSRCLHNLPRLWDEEGLKVYFELIDLEAWGAEIFPP